MLTMSHNKLGLDDSSDYGCDDLNFDLGRKEKWQLFWFGVNTRLQQPIERAVYTKSLFVGAAIVLSAVIRFAVM